jgi:predicted RNase H-like HicB family nuclease
MPLKDNIGVRIYPGEKQGYVATCDELNVVTQGLTLDKIVHNVQEALLLYLEGEDLIELGYINTPSALITLEIKLFVECN